MQIVENKHTTLKRVIAVGALAVVVMVIAGVFYLQAKDQDEQRFKSLVRQATGRIEAGHQDRVIAGFEDYIKTSPFMTHKPVAMVYLANAYEAKADYNQALKWHREVEKMGKADAVVYEGIAYNARQLGDRETAKTYYRKSIEYRQGKNAPTMEVQAATDALKALEAGE